MYNFEHEISEIKDRKLRLFFAIWVLGNYGSMDVVPLLFDEWCNEQGIVRRHIQDAIEKIVYRNSLVK